MIMGTMDKGVLCSGTQGMCWSLAWFHMIGRTCHAKYLMFSVCFVVDIGWLSVLNLI